MNVYFVMMIAASISIRQSADSLSKICNHFESTNITNYLSNSDEDSSEENTDSDVANLFRSYENTGEILTLSDLKKFFDDKISKIDEEEHCSSSSQSILTPVCMSETVDGSKKIKKKKRVSTICLANCKYNVLRKIASHFGMQEVEEGDQWNIYWTDLSVSVERAKEMKRFQKVNHFPGMAEICRKDLLARNLNRMLKLFPSDYNFFPKTWGFPADLGDVCNYAKTHPTCTFIIKPDVGCQGKGIFLTKSLKELKSMRFYERMICQIYISKPYLVDGFKFDMRVYTLVTSVDPLRIFVYNDGLARFATSRYKEPAGHNTTNIYMHLTNYAVNKHSRTYVIDDNAGSKRRLSTVNDYLKKLNEDVGKLWESIDDIIIKTIIAAYPVLKHSYNSCFATHDIMYACFELLGFDILLDNKLKPYLLEVNHSPSFHTDAKLDKDIKENLLIDTFTILNLPKCFRRRAMFEDKQRAKERLLQTLNPHNKYSDSTNKSNGNNNSPDDGVTRKFNSKVEEWEMNHLGNFRLVYPNDNCDKYSKYFQQNQCSIFQETFASRAREEASRIHKEEFETKVQEELSRRIGKKVKENRLQTLEPESPRLVLKRNLPTLKKKFERLLCSFEPTTIDEREEAERSASMTKRDYLVRSYGILNYVYQLLEQGGNIRIADLNKYKSNEKNKSMSSSDSSLLFVSNDQEVKTLINVFPKIQDANGRKIIESSNSSAVPIKCTLLEPTFEKCLCRRNTSSSNEIFSSIGRLNRMSNFKLIEQNISKELTEEHKNNTARNFLPGLKVTCNEAAMWTRPSLPDPAEWPSNLHAKSTRTFIARHFSNTMKLQDLESRLNADRELKLNAQRQSTL